MKKILLLFLAIFLIQSCAEPRDYIENSSPTAGFGYKVISKIKVNEVGGIPYDINYNWIGGKLKSITTSNNSSSYTLDYTGNQLTKISQIIGQGPQLKTRISNLVYTNGKLTTINGTETSAVQGGTVNFTTSISYVANNPSYINKIFQNGGASEGIYLTFNNTNISKINYILGTGAASINTEINLSNYDANPNPIHTLPIAFSITDSYLNEDTFGVLGLSTNNFKTADIQNSGIENTVYTYGPDGFPTKSVKPDLTLQYEYINL